MNLTTQQLRALGYGVAGGKAVPAAPDKPRAKAGTGAKSATKARNRLEDTFAYQWELLGYPAFIRQHRFCERRWRFDFAWPAVKVCMEVQGGIWVNGGHNRGAQYAKDNEKRERAEAEGWLVFYVFPGDEKKPVRTFERIVRAIELRAALASAAGKTPAAARGET